MNDMYYHHHPSKAMAMAANNDPSHSDGKLIEKYIPYGKNLTCSILYLKDAWM